MSHGGKGAALAVIPARGGSKGIPRKNVKDLAGKPLIAWAIEAARQARSVGEVVVSTDDDEIAAVARAFGAGVVRRPAELARDDSPSEAALLHVLDEREKAGAALPPALAFLQCTCPLTRPEDIDGTVALVTEQGYDSAVTGVPFHYFIWTPAPDGSFQGVNHDSRRRLLRQHRRPEFLEVGAVYAMRGERFRAERFRFCGRLAMHPIPSSRSLEIDDPDDWELAEVLLRRQKPEAAGPPPGPAPLARLDLSRVKAVVTDFDGVLTDNRVYVNADGEETVGCNRSDGWAARLLREAGYALACLSTETDPVVSRRCEKIGLPALQGLDRKETGLERFCGERGLAPSEVLYIGNDTNDLECLRRAGVAVAPADASADLGSEVDARTAARGGEGVLREVAAALLAARPDARGEG